MGPRSADRGNPAEGHGFVAFRVASMGPRSADRGNTHALLAVGFSDLASMGPRSADRGNAARSHGSCRQVPRFNGAAIS